MQTEEQVLQKVNGLVNDKLISDIKEEIKKVLKSGAINLEDFYDDYLLPKFLVAAVLEKHRQIITEDGASNILTLKNLFRICFLLVILFFKPLNIRCLPYLGGFSYILTIVKSVKVFGGFQFYFYLCGVIKKQEY